MSGLYDAESTLAISRQRGSELRAEADHDRLARGLLSDGARRTPWWRRWARRRAAPRDPARRVAGGGIQPALRWP